MTRRYIVVGILLLVGTDFHPFTVGLRFIAVGLYSRPLDVSPRSDIIKLTFLKKPGEAG